jgi:hypothetical protein
VVSRTLVIGLLVAVALVSLDAQWLTQPAPGIPRTKDGKPNLSAPAPRASDGKPDLSGLWHVDPPPPGEIERLFGDHPEVALAVPGDDLRTFPPYFVNILADFKPGDVAVLPEAAARKYDSAPAVCAPPTLPGLYFIPLPIRIVQTPQVVAILYEVDHTFRQIHTDGRKLPVDPQPSWLGYSVGRWEGRTLVAETVGFNDKTPIDITGNPRSESLRLTERFFRRDFGHLEMQFTIEDPKSYSKPFTIRITETLTPDTELLEYFCTENEKDRPHLNQ